VSLTTAATLLSPLAVPLALGLTLGAWDRQSVSILSDAALFMLWTVVLPVVAGHLLGRWLTGYERIFRLAAPLVANLAILWIIAVVVALNRRWLADVPQAVFWALVTINVGGYAAGYLGGRLLRLPLPMQKALTLEVGMQNAGLGATLATHLFPDSTATAIAPAMYTFGCMLTGTILARLLGGLGRDEPAAPPQPLHTA
jgi:BASS family bile acid:Na+ symporter